MGKGHWLSVVCLLLTGLIQGGFYSSCYLFVAILITLALPFLLKELPPLRSLGPLLLLLVVYLGSGICNGAGSDSLIYSSRLLACLLFSFVVYNTRDKKKLLDGLVFTMFIVAVVSVAGFAAGLTGMGGMGRLFGTFQYANTAGIYFAAGAILSSESETDSQRARTLFFETALLLTQSVGAVLCYVVGLLILGKRSRVNGTKQASDTVQANNTARAMNTVRASGTTKANLGQLLVRLLVAAGLAFSIGFMARLIPAVAVILTLLICYFLPQIAQVVARLAKPKAAVWVSMVAIGAGIVVMLYFRQRAVYTYIERLIHLMDSLGTLKAQPFFGLGPGVWEHTYSVWQTYSYQAAQVHSVIGQVAADAGILGLLALGWLLVAFFRRRSNTPTFVAGLIIVLHSLLDITLQFTGITFLLIVIYRLVDDREPVTFAGRQFAALAVLPLLVSAYLFIGQQRIGADLEEADYLSYNRFYPDSYKQHLELMKWYVGQERYGEALAVSVPYDTAEAFYIKSIAAMNLNRADDGWNYVIRSVEHSLFQSEGFELAERISEVMVDRQECERQLKELTEEKEAKENVFAKFM